MKNTILMTAGSLAAVFLAPLLLGRSPVCGAAWAAVSPEAGGAGSAAVASAGGLGQVSAASSVPPEEGGGGSAGVGSAGVLGQVVAENAVSASVPTEEPPPSPAELDGSVQFNVLLDGKTQKISLKDYLWGVVAAEMPAKFDEEALKAQAIAARTYTLYRMDHPNGKHSEDLCGDSTCCQAWISREDRLAAWPEEERENYTEKITRAVDETDGLILTSENVPILAVFHASSGGKTRSALEVWGNDLPYLVSVDSPEQEESVPSYYSTVTVPAQTFQKTFQAEYANAKLTGSPKSWFSSPTYDEVGLPTGLTVGGVTVSTGKLRTMFSLRSPTMTVEADEEGVTFFVTGYGHGVGMSQYGAQALAQEGKTAEEIVRWYYSGAELEKLSEAAFQ